MEPRPGGKKRTIILIALIGLLILSVTFGIMIPLGLYQFWSGSNLAKATGTLGRLPTTIISNSCVSPILPRIKDEKKFAEAIDAYVAQLVPSSPLRGLGTEFVKAGVQYGVNPAWEINIARKESSFGTHIPPDTFNSFGRTATSDQPHVTFKGRNWYKYDSFAQSAGGQAEYLRRRYIDKGLVTFDEIVRVYAPPSENDTEAYITQVKLWVGQVVGLAGDALDCEPTPPTKITVIPFSDWSNTIKLIALNKTNDE